MELDEEKNLFSILLNGKKFRKADKLIALEIYKLYHDSIQKTADKRQTANSFFLTLNTGVFTAIAFLFHKDTSSDLKPLYLLLPAIGVISAIFWWKLVNSYRQLNRGKFVILNLLEKKLPLAVYSAEWHFLAHGTDKKKYHQLTALEKAIPIVFLILHGLLGFYFIFTFIKVSIHF